MARARRPARGAAAAQRLRAAEVAGLEARGEPPLGPGAFNSVCVHDCSMAYALSVLADYGLDDWRWLAHDLGESMDDAALSAAQRWIRDHRQELENAAQFPRWCPCGWWPDFGVGCWYHGACRCVEWHLISANLQGAGYSEPRLAVSAYTWRGDWRRLGYEHPSIARGCPVHPDGPVPDAVLARWSSSSPLRLGGERGFGPDVMTAEDGGA